MTKELLPVPRPQRCPIHRMWMRKGKCELCLRAADLEQRRLNQERGIEPQKIIIKKL